MNDILPDISVKIDIATQEFKSRIYEICQESPQVKARESYIPGKEMPNISIEFLLTEKYQLENLYSQFFVLEGCDDRVWIELSSKSWAISTPLYYQYIELINQLIKPFVSTYNKRFQTRYKLHIPSYQQIIPRMSSNVYKVFSDFVNRANKSFLSSSDWEAFYRFIRACHSLKAKLTAEELRWFLLEAEFNEYYAEKLSNIYEHGRGILKKQYFPAPHPATLRKMNHTLNESE